MLLNILSLLLIILVAAYLANQGVLSSLLALISATFGTILAGALFEPLQGVVGGYRPDYARGITFLVLFMLSFTLCRLAADFAVPENIKFPKPIAKSIGGVFGLFTSLIIVGSLLVGIQMLPLPTSIFGYDRFSGDTGMQGDGQGVVATGSNIWLAPDRLVLALWNLTFGRSLGGDHSFASVHPDLLTEAYGYRNTVQAGVTQTLPPEFLKVESTWVSADAAVLKAFNITETGKSAVVVRAKITSNGEPPKLSVNAASSGSYFFVTPSEVRLVTNQGHQYYPIGFLEKGRVFTPTPLDSGQISDDFSQGKTTAIEDWVFEINTEEAPHIFEIKELARAELSGVSDKPIPPMASNEYAPHAYRQDQGGLHIVAKGFEGARMDTFKVYVIRKTTTLGAVKSLYQGNYQNTVDAKHQIEGSSGPWYANAGKPGVPGAGEISTAQRIFEPIMSNPPETQIGWDEFFPYIFVAKSTPDGNHNLIELPKFMTDEVVPKFTPEILLKQGSVDASGTLDLTELPKGTIDVIAAAKTDHGFYVWSISKEITPKTQTDVELSADKAGFTCIVK